MCKKIIEIEKKIDDDYYLPKIVAATIGNSNSRIDMFGI